MMPRAFRHLFFPTLIAAEWRSPATALLPFLALVFISGAAMAQTGPLLTGAPPVLGGSSSADAPGERKASTGSGAARESSSADQGSAGSDSIEETATDNGTASSAAGLWQLPSPPAASPSAAFPSQAPEWRPAEIAQAFECPVGPLAAMLEAAQGESAFSPALELEREVLVLCRDRWEVLKGMMDAELALAAVLRADRSVREREAIALEEQRQLARARVDEAREAARARVEGVREGAREGAREAVREARKLTQAAPKIQPPPAPEERYGWFAMTGSGADLRAGVTDGEGRWWVGVGDDLPGGVRIGSIRARPPRVVVVGGAALPWRPR